MGYGYKEPEEVRKDRASTIGCDCGGLGGGSWGEGGREYREIYDDEKKRRKKKVRGWRTQNKG